jgi:hypothetical protein
MEFTDRYQAMGIPYPEPDTMCKAQCEGTGVVPVNKGEHKDILLRAAWRYAHSRNCGLSGRLRSLWRAITRLDRIWLRVAFERCDGWHFVECPTCKGSGLRHPRKTGV